MVVKTALLDLNRYRQNADKRINKERVYEWALLTTEARKPRVQERRISCGNEQIKYMFGTSLEFLVQCAVCTSAYSMKKGCGSAETTDFDTDRLMTGSDKKNDRGRTVSRQLYCRAVG